MKTNKLLIFIIIGGVILTAVFFFAKSGQKKLNSEDINKKAPDFEQVKKEAEKKVEKDVPNNLIQCPEDIFSNMSACQELPDDTVCGYDHTVYENENEEDHGLEYRTPCHYCNFFGEDLVKDMMGTKVKALGYTKGECP